MRHQLGHDDRAVERALDRLDSEELARLSRYVARRDGVSNAGAAERIRRLKSEQLDDLRKEEASARRSLAETPARGNGA